MSSKVFQRALRWRPRLRPRPVCCIGSVAATVSDRDAPPVASSPAGSRVASLIPLRSLRALRFCRWAAALVSGGLALSASDLLEAGDDAAEVALAVEVALGEGQGGAAAAFAFGGVGGLAQCGQQGVDV